MIAGADGRERLRAIVDAARTQTPLAVETGEDEEHLTAAIRWLFRSQDAVDGRGSAATYNLLLGWEPPYPETTGYIIPSLYAYADGVGSGTDLGREARDRASTMVDWLETVQLPCGAFPGGTGEDGDPNVFNTGQAVFGLVEAARRTDDASYAAAVEEACDWLVDVQDEDGAWRSFDYEGEVHSYTTRVGWALLEGATVVENRADAYRDAAAANLRWARGKRRPNGWFDDAAFTPGDDPFLHTIAYTIRGLLEGGVRLDDDDLVAAARGSADVLLELQRRLGPLKGAYDAEWSPSRYHCLTGNAQMGIVWLRLHELTGEQKYRLAARESAEFLKRHQALSGADPIRGALPGSYPHVGRYLFLRYPNWATKFFADLLMGLAALPTPKSTPSRNDSGPLRVCLLFDGEYTERWAADAIEHMLAETETEISLVVINEDAGLLSSENVKRGVKHPAYAAYRLASSLPLPGTEDASHDDASHDDAVHIGEITGVDGAEWIRTHPTNVDGLWNELPEPVVARVAETSDVVFRRGFGLLRGSILSATEHGVLSYHHGDPRAYRGGPAGFWEYMHGEEEAGTIVGTLTDEGNVGPVHSYRSVDIGDCETWGEVRRKIYTGSVEQLAEAMSRIRDDDRDPMLIDDLGPAYHPPTARDLLAYGHRRYT